MNSVEVQLGDRSYTVDELPTRKNEAWRESLEEILAPLLEILRDAAGLEISGENLGDIMPSAELVAQVAMKSPATIRDLVLTYSPALEKDRDLLLDTAFDSEFVAAFQKILGLAYPFGGLAQAVRRISDIGS